MWDTIDGEWIDFRNLADVGSFPQGEFFLDKWVMPLVAFLVKLRPKG